MGTVFRNPNWLVPDNANKTKKANYSLDFDASSGDYISTTDLRLGNTYSISLWFKANSFPSTNPALISQYVNAAAGRFFIGVRDNGGRKITVFSAGHNYGSTTISTDTWYNVILVNNNNTATLYLNGSVDGNFTFSSAPPDTNILLGTLDTTPNNPWDGQICQVCIFDYALQPADVSTLYGDSTNGVGDPLSLTTPPVAYYPLGDELIWNNTQFVAPNSIVNINDQLGGVCFDAYTPSSPSLYSAGLKIYNTINGQEDRRLEFDNAENGSSVSFWVKHDRSLASTGVSYMINNGGTGGAYSDFNFRINNTNGTLFWHRVGSSVGTTVILPDNEWANLTIVGSWDGTYVTVKVYLNGVLSWTSPGTSTYSYANVASLGSISAATVVNQVGKYTNFAAFDKPLTQEEITNIYNNGEPTFLNGHDNLTRYYPITRDYITILNDALVIQDFVTKIWSVNSGFLSAENIVGDYPNQPANGLAYNIAQEDVKGEAPYSTNNIVSENGRRSQLLPFGAKRLNVADPTKYTITVDTRIVGTGSTDTSTFQLPLNQGASNDATINWGDGTTSTSASNIEHTYSSPGVYQITVDAPNYIQSGFKNGGYGVKDEDKIISVDCFGSDQNIRIDINGIYSGCHNMDIKALDKPIWDTASSVNRSFYYGFQGTLSLVNENNSMSTWDMPTQLTRVDNMFRSSSFNSSFISNWFTQPNSITNWAGMFYGCSFLNQPLNLNTSSGTSFSSMFYNASSFNQDISGFDLSSGTNLRDFLRNAYRFNNGGNNLDNVNLSSATNLSSFMERCYDFNGSMSNWTMPTGNCQGSKFMWVMSSYTGAGMNTWSNMTGTWLNPSYCFANMTNFNGDVSWINTVVGSMTNMFISSTSFTGIGLDNWDVSGVTNLQDFMDRTGSSSTPLNCDLSSWDVSSVTNFNKVFEDNWGTVGDISGWDVSSGTSFMGMFLRGLKPNFNVNLNSWDFSNALYMSQILFDQGSYNQPILWELGNNVTTLNQAFYKCGTGTGGGATQARWTDTVVNFAVKAYNNSEQPTGVNFGGQTDQPEIDTTQTQTENSVNYSTFYGTEWPSDPANFSLSIGGEPDLTGGGDYCKVVNVSGDNQLEGKDMYSSSTAGSDYVELLTSQISGDGTDVSVLIPYYWNHNPTIASTTGLTADYRIDGGEWINFIDDTTSSGSGSSSGSNASPVEGLVESLSFSSSFQVRLRIQTGQATANTCNVKSITITDGVTNIYTQDFSQQLGVGYDDGLTSPNSQPWQNAQNAVTYLTDTLSWTGL